MATKCIVNKSTLTGIADAIRAKGGTTETMKPGEMAAKIEAIPSGGGDICLDLIGSGRYDLNIDYPAHLSVRTSLEYATQSTSMISLGCVGDDLSRWEAQNNIGRVDAKLHLYIGQNSTGIICQPQINEGSNNWGSGEIYIFTPQWAAGYGVVWPLEINGESILISGRNIDEATNISDRSGQNVFARCLAALRADWAAHGKMHVATTQTSILRHTTELYKYA